MQIKINIPFKRYSFLIKKLFKKYQVKKYSKNYKLNLDSEEIDGISESLVIFPTLELEKLTLGYLINKKN